MTETNSFIRKLQNTYPNSLIQCSYDISESFSILAIQLVPAMWGQEVEVRSYGHNAVRIDGAMAHLYKEIIIKKTQIL